MEVEDDPFEVKLGDNLDFMKDEYPENEKCLTVLNQKVQTLKSGMELFLVKIIDFVVIIDLYSMTRLQKKYRQTKTARNKSKKQRPMTHIKRLSKSSGKRNNSLVFI